MPEAQKKHDLIIVGGSFAGLTAARAAAARGLSVLVLDRKSEPGQGVRTTGILVKEAADALPLPEALTRTIHGVRLYAPSLAATDHWSPQYFFQTTDTPGMMRHMAADAEKAGAVLRFGDAFLGAEETANGIAVTTRGGRTSARFLLGADGAQSAVARALKLDRNTRFLGGIELELEPVLGLDERYLHCFLDSKLAPGYIAWAAPSVGMTQIGVAVSHGRKPNIKGVIARIGQVFDLSKAKTIGRRNGLIPVSGPLKRIATPHAMLIGDAAGHCSPLTAGGIQLALTLGASAGEALAGHLHSGGPHPAAIIARQTPSYFAKGLMRRAMDWAPPNWLWSITVGTPLFRAMTDRVYLHRPGAEGTPTAKTASADHSPSTNPG